MLPILYYMFEGPPSRAVLLTLRSLKIDLNSAVKLKPTRTYLFEHTTKEFLALNPRHTVPFLDDNGFHLADSHAISQYFVETKAPTSSLIGHTARERAILNDRLYFEALLFFRLKAIFAPIVRGSNKDIPQERFIELDEALKLLNDMLSGNRWIAGSAEPTLADLHTLPNISSLRGIGLDLKKYAQIMEWYERCKTLPGFEENEEGGQKHADLFNERGGDVFVKKFWK